MFLRQISNSHRASPTLFYLGRECTFHACGIEVLNGGGENRHDGFLEEGGAAIKVQFCWRGAPGAMVTEMPDFEAWIAWIRSLDTGWVFLPIMLFVVVVVGLWSRSLKPDKTRDSQRD